MENYKQPLAKYVDAALASNFQVQRRMRSMDQKTLADELQVSPGWVTEYEAGRIGASHGMVRNLAKALNIQMAEVAEWADAAEKLFMEKIDGEKLLRMPGLTSQRPIIPHTDVLKSKEGDIRA